MTVAKAFLFLGIVAFVSGCTLHRPFTVADLDSAPPNASFYVGRSITCVTHKPPPNKGAVLSVLREDHILTPQTKVTFMRWNEEARKWHIVLIHAGGLHTYWQTDATALEYSGRTEKPSWHEDT